MDGVIGLTLVVSATASLTGQLATNAALSMEPIGNLTGAGAVVSAVPVNLSVNGVLSLLTLSLLAYRPRVYFGPRLQGQLGAYGSVVLTVGVSGTLTSIGGPLFGSVLLSVGMSGVLAPPAGPMVGSVPLTLNVAGTLSAVATDALAPTRATGLSWQPFGQEIAWSWDPAADLHDGVNVASGVKNYDLELVVNGGAPSVQIVSAADANALAAPTNLDVGSFGGMSITQSGNDVTMTGGGPNGIDGLPDQHAFRYWTVSGNFRLTCHVASMSGDPSLPDYAIAGLICRVNTSPVGNSSFIAAFQHFRTFSKAIGGKYRDGAGTGYIDFPTIPPGLGVPAWLQIERVGNLFSVRYSFDGLDWTTLHELTLAFVTSLRVGGFVTSYNALPFTAVLRDLCVTQGNRAQYVEDINPTDEVVARVRTRDNALNVSGYSASMTRPPEASIRIYRTSGISSDYPTAPHYTTFAALIAALQSGETAQLECASGNSQTVNDALVFVNRDYNPPVTIRVKAGQTLTINQTSGTQQTFYQWSNDTIAGRVGLFLKGSSGIIIDGQGSMSAGVLVSGLKLGLTSQWDPEGPSQGYAAFSMTRCFHAENSSNFTLKYVGGTGGNEYVGNYITRDCENYRLQHCEFTKHGTNAPDPSGDGSGDLTRFDGDKCLFEDVHSWKGGHDSFCAFGSNTVIRDCNIDGGWYEDAFHTTGGGVFLDGTRAATFLPANNTGRTPEVRPGITGPMLIEYCAIHDAGPNQRGTDALWNVAHKLTGTNIIVRFNRYHDNAGHLMAMSDYAGFENSDLMDTASDGFHEVYNNTSVVSGGVVDHGSWGGAGGPSHPNMTTNQRLYNNIFSRVDTNPAVGEAQQYTVSWDSRFLAGSYANAWRNSEVKFNLFELMPGISNAYIALYDEGTYLALTDAALNTTWPSNVYGNIVRTSPVILWANGTTNPDRTQAGFVVSNWGSGVSAGAASHHSTVATASSGTTVGLTNVTPFYDAWIDGDTPDEIAFGATGTAAQSKKRRIIAGSINRTAKTLVVDSPVAVSVGEKVWAVHRNGNVADNFGSEQ